MVRFTQAVLSIFSLSAWNQATQPEQVVQSTTGAARIPVGHHATSPPAKSIAIVGAGSAGIAVLKTIFDLPEDLRTNWRVVLFEQRRDVGGVWLPDPAEPNPPHLPETPLYPLLHTNTPHPTMTYPGFPFPPNTPLFPSHEHVKKYHGDVADQLNLTQYIQLNSEVYAAGWRGNSTHGKWEVEIHRADNETGRKQIVRDTFDHLVVGSGHNHYPRVPHFDGAEQWLSSSLAGSPKREILHSIFYRTPEKYANQTVVVVGGGASGRDAAKQVGLTAKKLYQSLKPNGTAIKLDPLPYVDTVGPISHFTQDGIVLQNGTVLYSVDTVILATGYQFLVPFLSRSPSPDVPAALTVLPSTNYTSDTAPSLQTNTRYIYPLHQHIFSLSPTHPTTALSFVGLPVLIANCPSDIAQSILIAHALADPNVLPSRADLLSQLLEREQLLRDRGYDPYVAGHKMVGGDDDAQAYQDELVRYLKRRGAIPDDGKDYVEQWRRDARKESFLLNRAWSRIENAGPEAVHKWLDGVETEAQWADLLGRLAEWEKKWESAHGDVQDDALRAGYWEAQY
ncbi:hypothetical protein EIP91_005504 [Steccherinum ochraceum]|uniref:FAD/NAD(P)-binding domain-containing protein n=1 Tax=Steccherinum ochraceum TaxID=92696 RepID=A0A4R0S2F9_9APHY|nr:hypothetical protein EIP91_005504 [Steccherinum ochraceum]